MLALYFTYSRGGLLALLVACGCLIALSHDRLWLLATLAIGALGALPAMLAVQARRGLADNIAEPGRGRPGADGAARSCSPACALALLLFAGAAPARAQRAARLTGRALAISRDPDGAERGSRLVAALVAIGAAIAVGGRAWDQFIELRRRSSPSQPEQHFSDLSGAGRDEFWRVALDAFGEEPVVGHGAGTYQFSWDRAALDRPKPVTTPTRSTSRPSPSSAWSAACSSSAWSAALLWAGFAAWRAARGPQRELLRGAASPSASPSRSAPAIDWFWEIAAVGAIFFLAAGALVAARCAPARPRPGRGERAAASGGASASPSPAWRVAWITALALIGPLLVDREIDASQRRRRRRQHRPAPSTTPTPPARSSPGRPPPTCSSGCWPRRRATTRPPSERLAPGDRPRRSATGCSTTCGRGSSTRPATQRPPAPTSPKRSGSTPEEAACAKGSKGADEPRPRHRAARPPPAARATAPGRRRPAAAAEPAPGAERLAPARRAAAAAARRSATGRR